MLELQQKEMGVAAPLPVSPDWKIIAKIITF